MFWSASVFLRQSDVRPTSDDSTSTQVSFCCGRTAVLIQCKQSTLTDEIRVNNKQTFEVSIPSQASTFTLSD